MRKYRRKINENDEGLKLIRGNVSKETFPFLMRTRNGWYIDPDPMHYRARKMIAPAVIILISTLFMRAITPVFSNISFISPILEMLNYSIRIGELDYPLFLFIAFPIFISPMIFRMIANMRDIKRQNFLISNPIESPDIEINKGENKIKISMEKIPMGLKIIRGRIQVGVAVPERKMILDSQGKKEGEQTIPGMSTRVQTPTLGFIVERELLREKHVPINFHSVNFSSDNVNFKIRFHEKNDSEAWLDDDGKHFPDRTFDKELADRSIEILNQNKTIEIVTVKEGKSNRSPKPPFTTDTMLQAASSTLGWSVSKTSSGRY